jgi:FixJ family two-component response regulator
MQAMSAASSHGSSAALQSPIVSIVDDDASFLESIVDLIESAGYRVYKFSTAEDFLSSDATQFSDLLITDIQMGGMDGLALMDAIAGLRRLPVIVITARPEKEMRRRAVAKGCAAFLTKPFDPLTLLSHVEAAVRRP